MNTVNEVKQWLKRAFYANKKVGALEELVKQCRERAERVSVCYGCNDTGKNPTSENGVENTLIRLADIESKAKAQQAGAVDVISEIQDTIALLCDDDLESVLINRYLNFLTIEETAEAMNYSPETVKSKQKEAIEKLYPLLPCFTHIDML